MADDRSVYLQIPQEVARPLIDAGLAVPYLRTERLDPVLVPTLVVAAATSLVTVVTTSLAQAAATAIARQLKKAFGNKGDTVARLQAAPGTAAQEVDLVTIPVDQLAALLRAAAGEQPQAADGAEK
ncbi:hypothetical protein [Paractinoplanes rishiriensis]|uniref:Uncharacterized protein n=1 Tax=Paractinoplanes rishiriensis TaxID=1050105 RepID=A0A919K264_9ACTN|nr:hypothetical protein [Actinoplanes rishiriensis]GIE95246.1 hypothetical protein Ari01nite_27110 [Actinoplanes rishiriensis]